MKHIIKVESFDNLSIVRPLIAMVKDASGEPEFSIKEPRTIITGTWDISKTDNTKEVLIRGEVTLNGKTDCYSLMFEDENSHLTINAGARLRIWQGGIVNNDCTTVNYLTIVEDAVNDVYGEFLIHPDVTVNNHPLASVNVGTYCKQTGVDPWTYVYNNLAILVTKGVKPSNDFDPVVHEFFPGTESYGFENYVYYWDGDKWAMASSWSDLTPFGGFRFSNNSKNGGVIYTFTGNLIGNEDVTYNFSTGGFDSFGCSHTSKIQTSVILSAIQGTAVDKLYISVKRGDTIENIEITNDNIEQYPYVYPCQAFVLHTTGGASTKVMLSYKDLVWDPSFEEEVTPTRSLLKSSLTTAKPAEIDTSLEDSAIFDNPVPVFPPEPIEE